MKKKVLNIHELRKMHEDQWKKGVCIVMSDGWTDRHGRSIINFLANSRVGTFYLCFIDCTAGTKTGEFISKGSATVIEKVKKDNIVQACTDIIHN